jgi:hypothetical protein
VPRGRRGVPFGGQKWIGAWIGPLNGEPILIDDHSEIGGVKDVAKPPPKKPRRKVAPPVPKRQGRQPESDHRRIRRW